MPDIVMILWLPAAIAFMAVTWVLTLSAVGRPGEDTARPAESAAGPAEPLTN